MGEGPPWCLPLEAAWLLKAESFADSSPGLFWGSACPHPHCIGLGRYPRPRCGSVLLPSPVAPVGSWRSVCRVSPACSVEAFGPRSRIWRRASTGRVTQTSAFAPESVSSPVRKTPTHSKGFVTLSRKRPRRGWAAGHCRPRSPLHLGQFRPIRAQLGAGCRRLPKAATLSPAQDSVLFKGHISSPGARDTACGSPTPPGNSLGPWVCLLGRGLGPEL